MSEYCVLRDVSAPRTAGPFELGRFRGGPLRVEALAVDRMSEPRIDREELTKREVQSLARDPQVLAVAAIMPTSLIRPVEAQETDVSEGAWGVTAVGADVSGCTGAGVDVAVLDTGIDATHLAFAGVTVVQEDFSGSGNGDQQGHGTHCAGTILGRDIDGVRIGVAPGVEKMLVGKVLADDGTGGSDMLFRGIQWAVHNHARVISMSLGFDFPELVKRLIEEGWRADLATSAALEAYRANLRMFDALMQLIERSEPFGNGIVVVAAAGNESRREENLEYEISVSLPAAAEGVISVGAVAESSKGYDVAPFSNTHPSLSGPGVGVLSAKAGGGLRTLSGTSMATPHVAGVAALWWEDALQSETPPSTALVTARLLASATTAGFAPSVDVADRGAGLVQAP